jgi:hypothetical protein
VASGWTFHGGGVLLWVALALPTRQAPAQEVRVSSRPYAPSPFSLRVDSSLVQTGVVVRDGHGDAIAGLTQGDFKILDDGQDRAITTFSIERSVTGGKPVSGPSGGPSVSSGAPAAAIPVVEPRYVALLFDDVHIRHGELMHARAAAERFVREALQPGDRVAIYIPPPEPGFWHLPRTSRS